MKKLSRIEKSCLSCESIMIVVSNSKREKKFCNIDCKNSYYRGKTLEESLGKEKSILIRSKLSESLKGENNPNYNNKWTSEKKINQSNLIKSKVNDEYRKSCSTGMKGKLVSEETKQKKRETENQKKIEGYERPNISEETRDKIGKSSKERSNNLEYKLKIRKSNEDNNNWIKLKDKDDYKFYCKLSNWKYSMLGFDIKGIEKIKDIKIYNKDNNRNGLVRDHRFSRRSGFNLGIFPEILRHPANCELIRHSDNIKKRGKNSIELHELFDLIINCKYEYEEQDLCLKLIETYKNKETYNKNQYINNYYETI